MSAMSTSPYGNGVILVGGMSSPTWHKQGPGNDFYLRGARITKKMKWGPGPPGGPPSLDSILELKADGQGWVGAWTTLSTKLQYPRYGHIVIPVLMNKDVCSLNGIVSANTGIT